MFKIKRDKSFFNKSRRLENLPYKLSKSELAYLQARDARGRFIKSEKATVYSDEVGDAGKKPKMIKYGIYSPSKILAFGNSIVINVMEHPVVLRKIKDRKGIYGEMKTRKLEPGEKIELADSYGKSKTRAIGVIIDK